MTVRGYDLLADWSRNGVYGGTGEDLTAPGADAVDGAQDITVEWGRNDARATEDATTGKLDFRLLNGTRKYSPENTASVIAGKVLPGTRIRFQVTNSGTITKLFEGPIDTLTVDTTAKTVTFEALDGLGTPGQQTLSTPVYMGQRTGDLLGIILDKIGWPSAARSIDPGATLVPYWWVEGVDASTAMNDLVHSEGAPAIAYVAGGVFYFRDRHHRLTRSASTVSQATYTHIIPAGSGPGGDFKILRDTFVYDHGLQNIINSATLEVSPRIPQDTQVVWSVTDPITLAPGETRLISAGTNDPFILAKVPDNTTSYLVDGTPTTDYHLAAGAVTVTLSRDSGQSVLITLVGDAALGAIMDTGLSLRAVPLTTGATYQFSYQDDSSISSFGHNNWQGTAPWAYVYDADVISQRVVAAYAQARPVITMQIASSNNLPAGYLAEILRRSIGDRITIRNDEMGINAPYYVERLAHTVKKLGVKHVLEIGCQNVEPTQPGIVFTFNTAGKGFNDGSFGAAGTTDASTMFMFDTAGRGFDDGRFAA